MARARIGRLVGVALALLSLAACSVPGSTLPVVKVGLIAPFEGPWRALGYDVYAAALLAVQEWNAAPRPRGWGVELVAVDDGLDAAQAVRAAGTLAVDPEVVAVIGPFSGATADAALPVLAQAGIPTLALAPVRAATLSALGPFAIRYFVAPASADGVDYAQMMLGTAAVATPAGSDFVAAFRAAAGREPGTHALLTYDATRALLAALAESIRQHGQPQRAAVADALHRVRWDGLLGAVQFQADGTVAGLSADWFTNPLQSY